MLRMTALSAFAICVMLIALIQSFDANAQRAGREEEPPKIYKERAKKLLDSISNADLLSDASPLTIEEQEQYRGILREMDAFAYDKPNGLQVKNHVIPISLRESSISEIKLGHTFTTTLVFTDAAGNPWSADTLTDISNSDVVSVVKKEPNIITVRPLKKAGQTNLPIKLKGHQRPLMFLFDIVEDEVYFNVDVKLDGLGDNPLSQQIRSIGQYSSNQSVKPKLTLEPAKELMLQFLTPEGYQERRLYNEFREPVDPRDFVAWTKDGRLYLLTPHDSYTPDPVDVTAASDGLHKLFEFSALPVITVRMGSKITLLYIE